MGEIASAFAAVPEPSEDEVTAAIYGFHSGSYGNIGPSFDDLPIFVRIEIRNDMQIALHSAAMVRAIAHPGAYKMWQPRDWELSHP